MIPFPFSHQPWTTPVDVQEESGCVIGEHYPAPMIDLSTSGKANAKAMQQIRQSVLEGGKNNSEELPHCRPSSEDEIRQFFWLTDDQSPTVEVN